MQPILVPIDFSEGSLAALQSADILARQLGCTLTLLHVVQRPVHVAPPEEGIDPKLAELVWDGLFDDSETLDAARAEMERFLAKAPETAVPKQVIFRAGSPAKAIVQAADKTDARMVVMSTHGRRGLARVFVGSTAEEVVRTCDCPVVAVKPYAPLR